MYKMLKVNEIMRSESFCLLHASLRRQSKSGCSGHFPVVVKVSDNILSGTKYLEFMSENCLTQAQPKSSWTV